MVIGKIIENDDMWLRSGLGRLIWMNTMNNKMKGCTKKKRKEKCIAGCTRWPLQDELIISSYCDVWNICLVLSFF
jgi:hypothetical protein